MNRFFTTLMVFIISFNLLQAQKKEYVITKRDFKDKNVSKTLELQFYKGEIYPLKQESGADKFFTVDTSNFKGVNDVEKLTTEPNDKSSDKDKFVQIMNKNNSLEDSIHVDLSLSSLSTITDTIWFVLETGDRIPFFNKKIDNISTAKAGKKFRLIIPNTITIWYNWDKLTEFTLYKDKDKDKDKGKDKGKDKDGVSTDWKLIIKIAVGVIVGIGIVGLFLYRKRNKFKKSGKSVKYITQKVPVKARYSSTKSLSEFAKENSVELKDLFNWNNITKTSNKVEQNKIKVELNGKDLIIRYEMINVEQPSETPSIEDNGETSPHEDNTMIFINNSTGTTSGTGTETPSNFLEIIIVIQDTIRKEIKTITDILDKNLELSKKIEELTKSGAEAKSRISKLENEKSESEKNVKRLQSEKSESDKNVKKLEDKKSDLEQEIGTLNDKVKVFSTIEDKVITVDFLKDYASEVYEYLKICGTVVDDAFKCYDSFNQQSISPGLLLTNYQTAVCSLPVGKWMQIVSEIKNKGIVVSDERLKQSLSAPVNNEEKQKEFQRTLFSEVLVKYSSNVLILTEAFSNLSRFSSVTDSVNTIENTFKKHFETIISSAKSAGLEIKPAHLFMNIDDFQDIEAIRRNRSLPYANIVGLQNDDIAEIVSYGIKTRFQSTKTQIILT